MARYYLDEGTLATAQSNYDTAISDFNTAKDALEKALGKIDWSDDAASKWKEKVDASLVEIKKMEAKLSQNKIVIDAAAQAAKKEQETTISKISEL